MDWYDEDPFDSIFREFFGNARGARSRRHVPFTEGEEEDRAIDYIETDRNIFLIFELPGYSAKDIAIVINDRRMEIRAQKHDAENTQEYLLPRLQQGIVIKKTLPQGVSSKKFTNTYANGILEVSFEKS